MVRDSQMEDKRVHLNLVKLKKAGEHFEIVVDPDSAIAYKTLHKGNVQEILKAQKIFSDASRGIFAADSALEKVFATKDVLKVAELILKEGEIQLTAEYRQMLQQQKRKQILNLIHRNGIDPRTKLPHPLTRIELAFEEANIRIHELKSADEQVQEILKKLRPILPISFSTKEIQVVVQYSTQHAGKVSGLLRSFGRVTKEVWGNDGSYVGVVEIPGGMEQELYDKLNSMTHGTVQCKVLNVK